MTHEKIMKTTHIGQIVVGDVIEIEAGKTIPGDALLLEGKDIEMDESAMTGESDKIKKEPYDKCMQIYDAVKKSGEPINEKLMKTVLSPVLLSGTQVFQGTGKYVVIVVGAISCEGKIMAMIQEDDDPQTPLQKKLAVVAEQIGKIGLYTAIATVVAMFIRYFIARGVNGGWDKADVGLCFGFFVVGLTVLVVAVPEGLPLAVTIALAYSVKKMYAEKNFVKTLMACETMGGANNICTDKTGTLTTNDMTVVQTWMGFKAVRIIFFFFIISYRLLWIKTRKSTWARYIPQQPKINCSEPSQSTCHSLADQPLIRPWKSSSNTRAGSTSPSKKRLCPIRIALPKKRSRLIVRCPRR